MGFLLMVCLSCAHEGGSSAQASLAHLDSIVGNRESCEQCSIRIDEVVILSGDGTPASPRPDAMVRDCMVGQLSDGRWVFSGAVGGGHLLVYEPTGQFLSSIGREGRGPGEFGGNLELAVSSGDTIHVIDHSNGRVVSVLPSGEPVGSFQLPAPITSFALLEDSALLFHSRPAGREGGARPLFYVLDVAGGVLTQFGRPTRTLAEAEQWIVSPGRHQTYWTAPGWRYELYQWRSSTSLGRRIVRVTDWFPVDVPEWSEDWFIRAPPPPWMTHVWEEDGILWTYSKVPDVEWEPGPNRSPTPDWVHSVQDMMIEAIDLSSGTVISRLRYDLVLAPVCGESRMYTVVERASGDTQVVILEPTLER